MDSIYNVHWLILQNIPMGEKTNLFADINKLFTIHFFVA